MIIENSDFVNGGPGGVYRMRDVGFGGSKNVGSGIWGVEICGIWDFRKNVGSGIWGGEKMWDLGFSG